MNAKTILAGIILALLHVAAGAEVFKCTAKEKQVYADNAAAIDSMLELRAAEEVVKLNNRYSVPVDGRTKLEHYIRNREFRLICQEFLYRDSLQKRVQNKTAIEAAYDDSINTVLIPAYDNHISGDNVSLALFYSTLLRLDSAQYACLMDKALDMARRIRLDHRTNVWNEEMELLKKTLDKKQLRSFFVNKNAARVTDEFDKGWARLTEAGLAEQLDSAKEASDSLNYLFSKYMIKDLYRNFGTPQKKNLAELDKNKPKMIRMLDALDKKARMEERQKTVGKEFIW